MHKKTPKAPYSQALRLQLVVVKHEPDKDTIHHQMVFDYRDLDQRWAVNCRIEDCLEQGYMVALEKVDPRAERLLTRSR